MTEIKRYRCSDFRAAHGDAGNDKEVREHFVQESRRRLDKAKKILEAHEELDWQPDDPSTGIHLRDNALAWVQAFVHNAQALIEHYENKPQRVSGLADLLAEAREIEQHWV